jgi:hypothetical protein
MHVRHAEAALAQLPDHIKELFADRVKRIDDFPVARAR